MILPDSLTSVVSPRTPQTKLGSPATLENLSATISSKTLELSKILEANSIPPPSFAESSCVSPEASSLVVDKDNLRTIRNELITAAQDLIRLAQGPVDHLLTLAWSAADVANLGIIAQHDIASKISIGSSISLQDLATSTGFSEDVLARTVRYAIANGIFCEPLANVFAHSAASATLAINSKVRDVSIFCTHEITTILVRLAEAFKQQQEKKENAPGAAFNVAYPGYEHLFEYFAKNPEATQRYVTFLDGRAELSRWNIEHLTTQWDWAAVGSGTIIDVGGSSGHTCVALTPAAPSARFIVQDLSVDALQKGRDSIASDPALKDRITYTEHDFFTVQPVTADVYFYRHILHDWSDADCVRIIAALLPGLKGGARVLIHEGIMPEPPAQRANTMDDKQIRIDDQVMMSAHNAKERSVAEFIRLFKDASEDFKFVGVTGGEPGVFQSLVEFVYIKGGEAVLPDR
ncbi:MAG: hypothetical protein Q9187_002772 [Circinaria calcarea]